MTTPGGVPNLPIGALTVQTLGQQLQNMSASAIHERASEHVPSIFENSTAGDILSELSPFGILSRLWAGFMSLVAEASPSDITGPEDLPELVTNFISELPVVGQLVDLLEAITGNYTGEDDILNAIQDLFAPIRAVVDFWVDLGIEGFLEPLFEWLFWLWNLFADNVDELLKPLFEFLFYFINTFGDVIASFVVPVLDLIKVIWDLFSDLFGPVAAGVLETIFQGVAWGWDTFGEPVLKAIGGLVEFIVGAIDIETLTSLLEKIVDTLTGILNPAQFVEVFTTIIEYFKGLFGGTFDAGGSVLDFVGKLPLIKPLVSAITGKTEADGVSLDLGTLSVWARDLERQTTDGVDALTDAARRLLSGVLPVSQIGESEENLLSQGDFLTSSTVDPASGWSWDSSRTRTGTGGSLKVACTGSSQRIYCRQDIKVTEGDRLTLSGYVGTTGFTSGSIRLSLVPWSPVGSPPVMTAQTIQNGNARTTSASTWQALPSLSYTVPSGITSVQVSLVVNCNSGSQVFFDDIALRKTGKLAQGLVTNLLDAIQGILDGAGFAFRTGWQFLEEALSFVTGTANDGKDKAEATNTTLFLNPEGGEQVVLGALPTGELADQLGTAGSGGKMTKGTGTEGLSAGPQYFTFPDFYDAATTTSDISYSLANGTFTVTHAGFYEVEVGFTVNGSPGQSGAFNVAPAVVVNGSLEKIGGTAFGSYGFGLGGYARTAHSTFIVYLGAGATVAAAHYNYFTSGISDFFVGGAQNTYFSIAMLNRTQDG